MLNPIGGLVLEVREATPIQAVIGLDSKGIRRVRTEEPAEGDAQGPGKYEPFIVFDVLAAPPEPDIPVTFMTIGFSCYGATKQNAWEVYQALVEALHQIGPRLKSSGLGIYQTLITGGGEQGKDPSTQQPVVRGVISATASTVAIGG